MLCWLLLRSVRSFWKIGSISLSSSSLSEVALYECLGVLMVAVFRAATLGVLWKWLNLLHCWLHMFDGGFVADFSRFCRCLLRSDTERCITLSSGTKPRASSKFNAHCLTFLLTNADSAFILVTLRASVLTTSVPQLAFRDDVRSTFRLLLGGSPATGNADSAVAHGFLHYFPFQTGPSSLCNDLLRCFRSPPLVTQRRTVSFLSLRFWKLLWWLLSFCRLLRMLVDHVVVVAIQVLFVQVFNVFRTETAVLQRFVRFLGRFLFLRNDFWRFVCRQLLTPTTNHYDLRVIFKMRVITFDYRCGEVT